MAFDLLYQGHVNLGDIIMAMVVDIASAMTLRWLVIYVLLIAGGLLLRFEILKRGTNENEISRRAFGAELYYDSVGKPDDIVFRAVFIW
jgi:hypothetical protein